MGHQDVFLKESSIELLLIWLFYSIKSSKKWFSGFELLMGHNYMWPNPTYNAKQNQNQTRQTETSLKKTLSQDSR